MEDLEALNVLEAKFAHPASPLSRKRKRTTPPVADNRLAKSSPMKAPDISKVDLLDRVYIVADFVQAAHMVRAPLLDVTAPANNAKPVSMSQIR